MKYFDVAFLHTNDVHSYVESFGKKLNFVEKIREQNKRKNLPTFLFDCGDALSGSAYFQLFKGDQEIALMNKMNYDAMVLGNHEFDYGDLLVKKLNQNAKFPLVATNLSSDEFKIHPFLERNVGEGKIFVLGATTLETLSAATPPDSVRFHEPLEALKNTVRTIKKRYPHAVFILLSHLGYEEDLALAGEMSDIQLIFGAHTHTVLERPVIVNHSAVFQAGSYGRFMGNATVRFYEDKTFEILQYDFIDFEEYTKFDEKTQQHIESLKEMKEQKFSKKIAIIKEDFDGERESLKKGHTNLSRLIVKSYFEAARKLNLKVNAALINGGGIRASLRKGEVKFNDLFDVLPFSKRVLLVEILGSDLRNALKTGINPLCYGIKTEYNQIFVSENQRFQRMKDSEKYYIATNDFVKSGKDYFTAFENSKIIYDLGLDIEVFESYLKEIYR